MCNTFRDLSNKRIKEKAKEIYNTQIHPKNVKKTTNQLIMKQTINNLYVQCDSLEVKIEQPYFTSYDNIFYVTIEINRRTIEEMIKKLKYIFINLMCGVNGKYIFPNEEKYSAASSFPVNAALYTIKNTETKPILHGLLKYQKENTTARMTVAKLQNMNKSNDISKKPFIKASLMSLWEDKKYHYCVKSFNDTIKTITSTTHHGSIIDDFY